MDENFVYGLLHKAKNQVEEELYEAAINTLKKAHDTNSSDKETTIIKDAIYEAEMALKRSKNKDYYKILGVSRDADDRQIKAAYRKMMKQHHPDKAHTHGMTKETAEKKMADINQAYEYLSSPEDRAKIDRGEDPANPSDGIPFQGRAPGSGAFPFMFQQGSGGQHFKFQWSNGFPGGGHGDGPFGFGG